MDSLCSETRAKRARSVAPDTSASSSFSPTPGHLPQPKVKKPKRAETRPCPVCSEPIPTRLLAAHAELEMQRVEDIIRHIGDDEVLAQVDDLQDHTVSKRRSALKARQSLTALQPLARIRVSSTAPQITNTTPTTIEHAIGYITRRRKARHARLKELIKEESTWLVQHDRTDSTSSEGEINCPVCSQPVRGDRDVLEAHVDACLAYESRQEREQSNGHGDEDTGIVDIDVNTDWNAARQGRIRARVITNASLEGTGILIRPSTMDTEDDVDVDGTDDAMFGDAQFGEADVLGVVESWADMGMDGDGGHVSQQQSNRDRPEGSTSSAVCSPPQSLVTDEDMDKLDLAILTARSREDYPALATALETKLNAISPPATCRICLSPYVDPTVSTGCWHTCCATCWLRCLGATKLCPMCQRITSASELRRVYL